MKPATYYKILRKHVPLRIDRELTLDLVKKTDAKELFEFVENNRAHLRRWLPWLDVIKAVTNEKEFVLRITKEMKDARSLHFIIRENGAIAGLTGFHVIDWANHKASIGYLLAKDQQGKGIMTRSCKALISFAFKRLKLNRVELLAAPKNKRSQAVTKRLKLKHEGCIRQAEWLYDHFVDLDIYSVLAKEWKN